MKKRRLQRLIATLLMITLVFGNNSLTALASSGADGIDRPGWGLIFLPFFIYLMQKDQMTLENNELSRQDFTNVLVNNYMGVINDKQYVIFSTDLYIVINEEY